MTNELLVSRRRALGMAAVPVALGMAGAAPAFAQQAAGKQTAAPNIGTTGISNPPKGRKYQIRIVNTAGTSNFVFNALLESLGILDVLELDAPTLNVADGTLVTKALLDGTADVCMQAGFAPVLSQIDNGKPLKIIGGGNILNPQTIYTAKPDIHYVKDLVGKTVGVGAFGAAIHQKIVALLRKRGVDDKKVKFVNVGSTLQIFKAVQAGTVDAGGGDIDLYNDQAKYGVHSLKDANMWTDLREYVNQASYTTSQTIATKRPELIRALAAYATLYRFLQSPVSRDDWMATWAHVAHEPVPKQPDVYWQLYQTAHPFPPKIALSPDQINYVQKLNISMGLQKHMLSYAQVADGSLAPEALKLVG